jgi:hypothetical protein
MKNVDKIKRLIGALLAVTLIVGWYPNQSGAASGAITPSDLTYSGPFEITAPIMEIAYKPLMLIVAEYSIYVVDQNVGSEHLLTVLKDADGQGIAFESLQRGQMVMVRGLKLPDGRIIAELIQTVDTLSDNSQSYEHKGSGIRTVRPIRPVN